MKYVFFVLLFLIAVSFVFGSIEVSIDSDEVDAGWIVFKNDELKKISYDVVFENELVDSFSLGELVPIMDFVYKIEFFSLGVVSLVLEEDELAEKLFLLTVVEIDDEYYFLNEDDDGNYEMVGFEKIKFYGDVSPNGNLKIWISWEGEKELKDLI